MCQRRFQRIEPGQEGLPSAKECRQKPLRPPFDFEPRGFRTAPEAYSFPYAAAFPFARGSEPYAQGQAFEMGATFAEPRIDGRGEYGLSGDPAPSAVCIFMHSRGNAEPGKPRAESAPRGPWAMIEQLGLQRCCSPRADRCPRCSLRRLAQPRSAPSRRRIGSCSAWAAASEAARPPPVSALKDAQRGRTTPSEVRPAGHSASFVHRRCSAR